MPRFSWTTDIDDAKAEQLSLRSLLSDKRAIDGPHKFRRGLAIGTAYDDNTSRAVAVGVPFDEKGRYRGEVLSEHEKVEFPYIPGLLAFRVGPAICKLLDQVEDDVDLLLFDGQGIAHPRGIGLAAHIGVLYDKPSLGVTRNNLFGQVLDPPHSEGMASAIMNPQTRAVVGHSIVLGAECPPIYVSPGHRLTVPEAVTVIRQISQRGTSFPGSLAKAHGRANALRRKLWREGVE
jgi:deoxyribonuclease V